jgi:hypothetical protein
MAEAQREHKADKMRFVQVGVVGIRDPEDRYKIIENVPIFASVTPEHEDADAAACNDKALARMLAAKFKAYMDGQGA